MTALPLDQAAAELQVSPVTLRRWIRAGCPVARRGRRGRSLSTLVDVAAVRRWKAEHREPDPRAALLEQLVQDVPGIAVDAVLATLAEHSARVQGGGEARRLREAVGDTARAVAASLERWAKNRSPG